MTQLLCYTRDMEANANGDTAMTTYTLTLHHLVNHARIAVKVEAASRQEARKMAQRRYCRGSNNQVVVE